MHGLSLNLIAAKLDLISETLLAILNQAVIYVSAQIFLSLQGSRFSEDKFMTTHARQLLNEKGHEIYSVLPETMVYDAIKLMTEEKVGALLVIENNKLVGIISERDYTRKVILENRSSHETPVKDIMTSDVLTVTPDQTVEDCMKVMSEHHIRHLPVAENGQAIGIISMMDVVKNIISEKEIVIDQLEHYIAG